MAHRIGSPRLGEDPTVSRDDRNGRSGRGINGEKHVFQISLRMDAAR
jgi:hypothetical protein